MKFDYIYFININTNDKINIMKKDIIPFIFQNY